MKHPYAKFLGYFVRLRETGGKHPEALTAQPLIRRALGCIAKLRQQISSVDFDLVHHRVQIVLYGRVANGKHIGTGDPP